MTQTTALGSPGVPAAMSSVWGPPTVMPFPLPWGGAGCCPPGGMDALMKCYCDIQQASAFIGQIMIDQINNNPAVTAAIIAAIEKSGSTLPLIGSTDGQPAQPGQVGEFIQFEQDVAFPVTASYSQTLSMGVLQPGDWNVWAYVSTNQITTGLYFQTNPTPVGFFDGLAQELLTGMGEATVLLAPTTRAVLAVPTLIPIQVITNTGGAGPAGTASVYFNARRMR